MAMTLPLTNYCAAQYDGVELTGKWSLLWGGTQLKMFTFKASNVCSNKGFDYLTGRLVFFNAALPMHTL